MTNRYEDEMFQFFTGTEETFTSFCNVQKHYVPVKERLLEGFWQAVKEELHSRIAGSDWMVKLIAPVRNDKNKLMFYKTKWGMTSDGCPALGVAIEHLWTAPFYGPFVHNHFEKRDYVQANAIIRAAEVAKDPAFEDDPDNWYPFWGYTGLNFGADEDLLRVLPFKRADAVTEHASMVLSLAAKLEQTFEQIHSTVGGKRTADQLAQQ